MHALAGKRVQVNRKRGDKGFTFPCLHFRDHALVQDHTAQQLHIEMALAEGSFRRFADRCKGIDQQVVEAFAVRQTAA